MVLSMKGLTAIVTGASGGIGRVIAKRLSDIGMRLTLCGRSEEKLTALATETGGALILPGDLTNDQYIQHVIEKTVVCFGGLDVLINAAGLAMRAPFESVSEAQYDAIMAVNVKASFFMTQRAMPYLRASPAGTVINIASSGGHTGYPMQSVYNISKHALIGLTKSVASEAYKDGVRVMAVSPGGVNTDMIRVARPDLDTEGMIDPGDVADAVEYLLTHRGSSVIDEVRMHRAGKEPFT